MSAKISIRRKYPRAIEVIEHQIITMPDGCELSARIWIPNDAEISPVPAIIEHLPYRKRDGTIVRDSMNHPWFAGHGYACIRVDMRGNGDSQGLMHDEYTEQELQDACDVIQWAAKQPWCTGNTGMMGISWGGFNALQVASLQPTALKAIITVCSTVDRFADDIHFKGGCLLGENIGWAANMLSYSSRPPDPLLIGEQWRELWLARLENMPFLATTWLGRQRRDAYWKHGSVCEDYASIDAAVLSIGGWHDGYRNAISHLVENLSSPVKGIVGPWIHKYPHYAAPAPKIGFLQESLRWWDHWLKEIDTGAADLPAYRAYLMDGLPPAPWYDERPGRWIAEDTWPSKNIGQQCYVANKDSTLSLQLEQDHPPVGSVDLANMTISTKANCGSGTGEYFPFTFGPELPDDQRNDDTLSCCFDTDAQTDITDIVGAPVVNFNCSVDKQLAHLTFRLCDIQPDGSSTLITMGMLNLTHVKSHEFPERILVNTPLTGSVALDQAAYRLPIGHKLRLSISSAYWPFLWPSPETVTVTLHNAMLNLPTRISIATTDECTFDAPEMANAWDHEVIREASSTRERTIDPETGFSILHINNDFGENRDADHQLISGSKMSEKFSIHPDNPASASVDISWEQKLARDEWNIKTSANMHMHSDLEWFYIKGSLTGWENDAVVFHRDYDEKVKRRFV
jgi:putative CocE/NonD family hydrolase